MTKRILIYPYSMKSASAKLLKEALGAQFILKSGSQYVPRASDIVINWGSGWVPCYATGTLLNRPACIAKAINKERTLAACDASGVPTIPYTRDVSTAQSWLANGKSVVVRHTSTGSGGEGIEIVAPSTKASEVLPGSVYQGGYWATLAWIKAFYDPSKAQEMPIQQPTLPAAPLYTQLIQKEAEFRVHAAGGKCIHTQMKLRKNGTEPKDVWNHSGGYTFTSQVEGRIDPSVLHTVRDLGVRAIQALGLDFGAADIAWSDGKGFILEVNTAPGIEEPTLSKYVAYFRGVT